MSLLTYSTPKPKVAKGSDKGGLVVQVNSQIISAAGNVNSYHHRHIAFNISTEAEATTTRGMIIKRLWWTMDDKVQQDFANTSAHILWALCDRKPSLPVNSGGVLEATWQIGNYDKLRFFGGLSLVSISTGSNLEAVPVQQPFVHDFSDMEGGGIAMVPEDIWLSCFFKMGGIATTYSVPVYLDIVMVTRDDNFTALVEAQRLGTALLDQEESYTP